MEPATHNQLSLIYFKRSVHIISKKQKYLKEMVFCFTLKIDTARTYNFNKENKARPIYQINP